MVFFVLNHAASTPMPFLKKEKATTRTWFWVLLIYCWFGANLILTFWSARINRLKMLETSALKCLKNLPEVLWNIVGNKLGMQNDNTTTRFTTLLRVFFFGLLRKSWEQTWIISWFFVCINPRYIYPRLISLRIICGASSSSNNEKVL